MFQTLFFNPLFNILILFYNTIAFRDFGLAIIFLTIFIRVILLPLFYKSAKDQAVLQRIQPAIQEIRHNHKDNREKQAQAIMELYKKHKANPFSGFLLLLVQLPLLIALYQVFLNGFEPAIFDRLYDFISRPAQLSHGFLGLINLQERSILIVGLAALAQYFQGRLTMPKPAKDKGPLPPEQRLGRQMVFLGPFLTVAILSTLPAAVGLYWLVTSVFSIGQQIYFNKAHAPETDKTDKNKEVSR